MSRERVYKFKAGGQFYPANDSPREKYTAYEAESYALKACQLIGRIVTIIGPEDYGQREITPMHEISVDWTNECPCVPGWYWTRVIREELWGNGECIRIICPYPFSLNRQYWPVAITEPMPSSTNEEREGGEDPICVCGVAKSEHALCGCEQFEVRRNG